MIKRKSPWLAILATLITLAVPLYAGLKLVGSPIRLVEVLTLFFSGMAGGAGLTQAIARWRAGRGQKET